MWNAADKADAFAVACSHCPKWTKVPLDMVTAYTAARRHAYRFKGHTVAVINLTKLTVPKSYKHEIPADQSTPLF